MSKEIPLTQGKVALVDDDDYEELSKYKWCVKKRSHTCYAKRSSKTVSGIRHTILMHTVILETPKGMETDHINGNGLDNRKENLRIVTRRGNAQNRRVKKTSKYIGVTRMSDCNRWRAQICINGKKGLNLGLFENEIDAANAYAKACADVGDGVL